MSAPACTYCGRESELTDGASLYPDKPHMARRLHWYCEPCAAWATCDDSGEALGRFANAELRTWKQRAHQALDQVWKDRMHESPVLARTQAREWAYDWLVSQMHSKPATNHISSFDVDQCAEAVLICSGEYLRHKKARGIA